MTADPNLSLSPYEIEQALVEYLARRALEALSKTRRLRRYRPGGGSVFRFRRSRFEDGKSFAFRWYAPWGRIQRIGFATSEAAETALYLFKRRCGAEGGAPPRREVDKTLAAGVIAFVVTFNEGPHLGRLLRAARLSRRDAARRGHRTWLARQSERALVMA